MSLLLLFNGLSNEPTTLRIHFDGTAPDLERVGLGADVARVGRTAATTFTGRGLGA